MPPFPIRGIIPLQRVKAPPADWKSGDILWLVDLIAPYGGQEAMLKDLKTQVFAEQEMRYLAVGPQGATVKVA